MKQFVAVQLQTSHLCMLLLVLFELVMVQKCFGFFFAAINHTHAQTSPSCVHSSCVVGKIVLGSRLVIAYIFIAHFTISTWNFSL